MEEKGGGKGREATKCYVNLGGPILLYMFIMINSQWGKQAILFSLLGTKDKVFSISKFRNECKSAAGCKSFPRQVHGYK